MFRISRRETARDGLALADDPRAQPLLEVAEAIGDLAEDHVLGDLRRGRHHRHDVGAAHVGTAVDLGAHGGRVEPANRLVRQAQVPQVARRHVQRHLDGVVVDAHAVVAFEPRPDVLQDSARLVDGRFGDQHGAEAARQRLVFLDELLVLAQRGGADDAHLAPGEHALEDVGRVRRRAQRRAGADERVRLVDEQDQVRALAQLAQHVLHPILEHAAQHRPGDQAVQLQADDVALAEADRQRLGLELDAAGEALGNRRLADAGLADEHHRIGALAVAQHLDGLLNLGVAPVHERQLVLAGEQVQVGREVLEKRRQLVALLQPLVFALDLFHARRDAGDQRFRLDAGAAHHRGGQSLAVLEDRGKQVRALDGLTAGACGVVEGKLEHQLAGRRDAQVRGLPMRLAAHLGFDGLEDGLRMQVHLAQHLGVELPVGLREGDKQMLVAQDAVLPAPGVVDGSVDDALGRLTDLAGGDVEIFHVTLRLLPAILASLGPAVVDQRASSPAVAIEVVGRV